MNHTEALAAIARIYELVEKFEAEGKGEMMRYESAAVRVRAALEGR